jgi:hypothetical protein
VKKFIKKCHGLDEVSCTTKNKNKIKSQIISSSQDLLPKILLTCHYEQLEDNSFSLLSQKSFL